MSNLHYMTRQLSPMCKLLSRNVTKWQSLTVKCWLTPQNLYPTQNFFRVVSGPIRKEEIQKLNSNQIGVSSVISMCLDVGFQLAHPVFQYNFNFDRPFCVQYFLV